MLLKNKKGVSELVSFALLTLLVVITSLTSYLFAKTTFQDAAIERDYEYIKNFLVKIESKSDSLTYYDSTVSSEFISFTYGQLIFENNTLSYQSLIPIQSDDLCIDSLCYLNKGGFERLQISFDRFNFSSNFTMLPGKYHLRFEYHKNVSEVLVSFD
jgi:hypothetical protein